MDSTEDDWFTDSSAHPGPSLEDFLAADPSQLPFLHERPATEEDYMRYQIFADDWGSIEHLQHVSDMVGETHILDTVAFSCCAAVDFLLCGHWVLVAECLDVKFLSVSLSSLLDVETAVRCI